MPRSARVKSASNIYHVMLRGSNHQQIFFDNEDYAYFIQLLDRFRAECGYKLYAYCLMGNHIHLLISSEDAPLDTAFRHIATAFVYWYNLKYERVGHLFQDRFRSEPVENEKYFLTVLRYILRNPVAAGYCESPWSYAYSSAGEYYSGCGKLTDISFAGDIIERTALVEYVSTASDDVCMDCSVETRKGVTDSVAIEMIKNEFGTLTPEVGMPSNRKKFTESVIKLNKAGVSIRQLCRLTGLSKKIIENCTKR